MQGTNTQRCDATLSINGAIYSGETGQNTGHAEIDALEQYLTAVYNDAPGQTPRAKTNYAIAFCKQQIESDRIPKIVTCPSRPCCVKCSAVLRALGFQLGANSSWSNKRMEMTQWYATNYMQKFLAACNVDFAAIDKL